MPPMKRSSVPGDGGPGPSKRRKSAPGFLESSGGGSPNPSKREMELEAMSLDCWIRIEIRGTQSQNTPYNPHRSFSVQYNTAQQMISTQVTQLLAENKELKAENEELKGQLSVVQHNIETNRTRSEPVGGDQYKVKILGTIGERVYTGSDVVGQDKKLLKAVLYYNDKKVTWDPFASAEFEILVVQGDFCQKSWSAEEFEQNLVKARKEVGVILTSVYRSKFSDGEKDLHGLKFKDNSSWADGKKWRLGVRVLGSSNVRILEAISEPFRVLDRHGKGSEKPHPPLLTSGVECLERVGHKRALILKNNGIHTVGHFLQRYHKKQNDLLEILSIKSDSDESWIAMIRHAKECDVGPSPYNYTGTSTDDGSSQSGQADVQDVNTNYSDYDASTACLETETDGGQNVGPDHCTVQPYNLIQDQTAGVQDIQLVSGNIQPVCGNIVLSDSDHQLPDTEIDADQYARSDHSLVQNYNLIQGETSIQEMEQDGSFLALISTRQLTLALENLLDDFEPYSDGSQHPLITATVHHPYYPVIPEEQIAHTMKELNELIVGKASLREGIVAVFSLIRLMRRCRNLCFWTPLKQ